MPLNADEFANSLFADGADETSVTSGALDATPIDVGPKLEMDYRDMGGLQVEADSAFFDALQRGTDNMQGSLYATSNAIGALTGFDALAEFGEEGFRDQLREAAVNPPQVESYEDVESLSTLGTYIAEAVGENVMNMASMATGAGISLKMAQAGVGKAAMARMSQEASSRLAKKAAMKGAAVPSYGMGAGEVQGDFIQSGIDAPGTALLAGIPIAGLDVFGLEKVLGVAFGGMPIKSATQLVTQAVKGFGVAGAAEMPTEAAQELIGMVAHATQDPNYELFSEENIQRLKEAGIKGGLAGGVMGGAGATAVGVAKGLDESATKAREDLKAKLKEGIDPEDQDHGPTTPESESTLQAGVDAIGRGGRKAAYSADPQGFSKTPPKPDHIVIKAKDGGSYYVHQDEAANVAALDEAGKQAEILGYHAEKPEGEENPTVVRSRDAQGRTVQDVATSEADLATAKEAGQVAAGPDGTIEVTNVSGALNDRAANYEEDAGQETSEGNLSIDPDDLIGVLTDEAVLADAQVVTAKHNTTARLINKMYGSTSKTNTDGSRQITLPQQDPKATQGDPNETHPLVVKEIAKMFDDGKTEERGRIQVHNPHSKGGTNTPVSLASVARVGRQLNQLNETATDRKANLMTGLGWLYEKGFTPSKVRAKVSGKYIDRDLNVTDGKSVRLGLPLNTVVDGRESNGTAVTFGDVMGVNGNKAQKKLQAAYDKKSAMHKAMTTGPQSDRNKATMKYKTNATMLGNEVAELKATLKDEYGVEFKDGQGDSREMEAPQGATAAAVEVENMSFIKGKAKSRPLPASVENQPDTRGMATDQDQAKASARDVTPKSKGSVKFPVLRNNKVTQYSEKLNKKLVDVVAKTLTLIGIKSQVKLVDEAGAVFLIEEMKQEIATNPERAEVLNDKIAAIELMLTDAPNGRVIYNDHYEDATDRVPMIFVSQGNVKMAKQMRVLTHEVGHLVQRVYFDKAPQKVQDAIRNSIQGGPKASQSGRFEENFANMLWRYMMDLDAKAEMQLKALGPGSETSERGAQLKDLQVTEGFFKNLAKVLRKVWQSMKGKFGVNEEYREFVDAMVGVSMDQRGLKPVTRMGKKYKSVIEESTQGPFLPHNPNVGPRGDNYSMDDIKAMKDKVTQSKRGAALIGGGKNTWALVQDKVLRSADGFLRSMNSPTMKKIADQFHHEAGTRKTTRDFFEEKRYEMGQKQDKIDDALSALPRDKLQGKKWWRRDEIDMESGEYVQVMQMLKDGVSKAEFAAVGGVVGETGVKVREYFDRMIAWQKAQGMTVRTRKNYFPAMAEKAKWETKDGRAKVMAAFKRHGYTTAYAEQVIASITKGDGYIADTLADEDSLLGPGFSFMKKRQLSPEILKTLNEDGMMMDDLQGILQLYTHASVERGVTQKRWGLTTAEKSKYQSEFTSLGIANQHLNSPVAKLHLDLARAKRDGEITELQARDVKNKVLEAYFGRLGANLDPRWQKFQGMAIMYQNMRLLSMSVLTALVDAPQIAWRAGDIKTAMAGFKSFMDKSTREELYETAKLMGAISDQLTEHVLNDQTTTQFMSARAKQLNERFFKFIGMHQWTNMTRVMGLSVGKEFLAQNSNKAQAGDATAIGNLGELGVTPAQIEAWQADGYDVNNGRNPEVVAALNNFIDEAVIRPDATTRPVWASDRNFQLFFHLKSFAWGYHETILKRIWNKAKAEPTLQKALIHGGISAMTLVAMTLPFAIAGYEIRRLLSWWGSPPAQSTKHGASYIVEVAERAGYLGLFQFIADAEQASDFGRLSILSALGPTVSQLEEILTDDYANIITRATPFMAQSGAARSIGRDILRGDL